MGQEKDKKKVYKWRKPLIMEKEFEETLDENLELNQSIRSGSNLMDEEESETWSMPLKGSIYSWINENV